MSENDDLLDIFLSVATSELENSNTLKESDIFSIESNTPQKNLLDNNISNVHTGDTDSSDDESNRNCEDRKYNESGREIKQLLCSPNESSPSFKQVSQRTSKWTSKPTVVSTDSIPKNDEKVKFDVYIDPVFGLRIVNPLISSAVLKDRMVGREAVSFAKLNRYLQTYSKEKDWVIAGVIVNKSPVKTSQKGSQFSIWTLSDLKDDIKTVALFLFSSAHQNLWKTSVGTVVGILNPNVLDKRDGSKDEACLSVDNSQKVMIFGQSKDFGTCKSVKKNGEKCTAIVNLNRCEFCIYHIKQEYQKCSKRSELQANFVGRGLTALRNKVLGKNEVFYAGKSYMAIPAKKSKKIEKKDTNRLQSLLCKNNGVSFNSNNVIKAKNKGEKIRKLNAARLDVSHAQRVRDIELLKKLGSSDFESKTNFNGTRSSEITLEESKNNALTLINKLKDKNDKLVPTLSNQYDLKSDLIVNVDNKTSFSGKISETVTLDKSKSTVLHVITKLKSRTPKETTKDTEHDLELSIADNVVNAEGGLDNEDVDLGAYEKSKLVQNTKTKDDDSALTEKLIPISTKNNLPMVSPEINSHMGISKSVTNLNKPHLKSSVTTLKVPVLSGFSSNGMIDLNQPVSSRHANRAKLNAIKLIKKNGPLKKVDPNNIRGTGVKRIVVDTEIPERLSKKTKVAESGEFPNSAPKTTLAESEFISDRFKKMMAATSKHMDLLEARDDEEKEKYFNKLEMKENMEEKMATTLKMACKAVRCLKCKYTSFSASELCKTERHPLRVFDAMKRFFKCGNCQNRIVSLEIFPTRPCSNCGSSTWEKTGMIKEKLVVAAHSLSIRGMEEKFTNSVIHDPNINLLVPDAD